MSLNTSLGFWPKFFIILFFIIVMIFAILGFAGVFSPGSSSSSVSKKKS